MNFYITTESVEKLSTIISNIKSFYILDIQQFISNLGLDINKPSNVYYINKEIEADIQQKSKLKKYHGIIYINKNLNTNIIKNLQNKFQYKGDVNKIVLIDNSNAPKHSELYNICEEVFFYEPFIKTKIMECRGIYKDDNGNSLLNTNI